MPIRMHVSATGTERALAYFGKRLPSVILQTARTAAEAEATHVLERAKELVPTDVLLLRESGRVEERYFTDLGFSEYDVVFGDLLLEGEHVYYSWIVHEDLDAYHDDGQAKYLETAGLEAEGDGATRISETMRRELRAI